MDFATAESPYRSATKGWINDDVFLQWGARSDQSPLGGEEVGKISVFWKPINEIALILFGVVAVTVALVFVSVSFSSGNMHLPAASNEVIIESQEPDPTNDLGVLKIAPDTQSLDERLDLGLEQKALAPRNTSNDQQVDDGFKKTFRPRATMNMIPIKLS